MQSANLDLCYTLVLKSHIGKIFGKTFQRHYIYHTCNEGRGNKSEKKRKEKRFILIEKKEIFFSMLFLVRKQKKTKQKKKKMYVKIGSLILPSDYASGFSSPLFSIYIYYLSNSKNCGCAIYCLDDFSTMAHCFTPWLRLINLKLWTQSYKKANERDPFVSQFHCGKLL